MMMIRMSPFPRVLWLVDEEKADRIRLQLGDSPLALHGRREKSNKLAKGRRTGWHEMKRLSLLGKSSQNVLLATSGARLFDTRLI